MTEDVFADIPTANGILILDKDSEFYYPDNEVVFYVRELLKQGQKFVASSTLTWGQKKLPFLIVNNGSVTQFEERIYMAPGNPVPQMITPIKVGRWTIYKIDFL